MFEGTPRFLVLRGGAVGDFIVTLPVLSALREHWPGARLELVGYPHIAALAEAGGLVEKVHPLDRATFAPLFARGAMLSPDLVHFIRSFDLLLTYLYDPDGIVQENLEKAGATQVIYQSPMVDTLHAVDHFLQPLERLAVYPENSHPSLVLAEDVVGDRLRRLDVPAGERLVALHPGSGSPGKNWPLERFAGVAMVLEQEHLEPFFLLGEADEPLRAAAAASGYPVLAGCSLVEVAAMLSRCGAYLGNDSGISHLAAAVGCPTVALFGPSSAAQWAPRGARVTVVQAPDNRLERLSTDKVLDAVRERVS